MSEVNKSQNDQEMVMDIRPFEAISDGIKSLQEKIHSKWAEFIHVKNESQISLGHEIFQLQLDIYLEFCQLRYVCKDEDAVKKFKTLFLHHMATTEMIKKRSVEFFSMEIRKNEALYRKVAPGMQAVRKAFNNFNGSEMLPDLDDGGQPKKPVVPDDTTMKSVDETADEFPKYMDDLVQFMYRILLAQNQSINESSMMDAVKQLVIQILP